MGDEYPSDWESRRKKTYSRDRFKCQRCGKTGSGDNVDLHAHHIVPINEGGSHELSNLQTVCSDCHYAIHGNSVAPTGNSDLDNVDWEKFEDQIKHGFDFCVSIWEPLPPTIRAAIISGMLVSVYLITELGVLGIFLGSLITLVFVLCSTVIWTAVVKPIQQ